MSSHEAWGPPDVAPRVVWALPQSSSALVLLRSLGPGAFASVRSALFVLEKHAGGGLPVSGPASAPVSNR